MNQQRKKYCFEEIKPYNPYQILNISTTANILVVDQKFREIERKYSLNERTNEIKAKYIKQKFAYKTIKNDKQLRKWKQQWAQNDTDKQMVALPSFLNPKSMTSFVILGVYLSLLILIIPIYVFISKKITSLEQTKEELSKEITKSLYDTIYDDLFDNYISLALLIEAIISTPMINKSIRYSDNDSQILPQIRSQINSDLLKEPKIKTKTIVKAQTLLCAHFCRIKLPKYLHQEMEEIVEKSLVVIQDLINYFFVKQSFEAMILTTRLSQMVCQACTIETEYLQLPEFDPNQTSYMQKITTSQLSCMNHIERLQKLHEICKNEHQLKLWKNYLMYFPTNMEIDMEFNNGKGIEDEQRLITLELRIMRKPITYTIKQKYHYETRQAIQSVELKEQNKTIRSHTPMLKRAKEELFYVFVEINSPQSSCFMRKLSIPLSPDVTIVTIDTPIPTQATTLDFCIYLMSDCYLGCEYCIKKVINLK